MLEIPLPNVENLTWLHASGGWVKIGTIFVDAHLIQHINSFSWVYLRR